MSDYIPRVFSRDDFIRANVIMIQSATDSVGLHNTVGRLLDEIVIPKMEHVKRRAGMTDTMLVCKDLARYMVEHFTETINEAAKRIGVDPKRIRVDSPRNINKKEKLDFLEW